MLIGIDNGQPIDEKHAEKVWVCFQNQTCREIWTFCFFETSKHPLSLMPFVMVFMGPKLQNKEMKDEKACQQIQHKWS